MASREKLSVLILAGGENKRMGSEKAFLDHEGRSFIATVVAQMSRISDDVVVMTGDKDEERFRRYLAKDVRVFKDRSYLSNPLGGILSGLEFVSHDHAAIVGCDTPLLKAEVIEYLFGLLGGHAAAVPIRERRNPATTEPLCAVYSVAEAKEAALGALGGDRQTAKHMVALIRDVRYVDVALLRSVDPLLESLVDVNTPEEYAALQRRSPALALVSGPVGDCSGRPPQ